jgi:hypothetical protein
MKRLAVVAALAGLAGAFAFAADPPATPSAMPVANTSLKVCNKQADARRLSGAARAQFVKHCHSGKT